VSTKNKIILGIIGVLAFLGFIGHISSSQQIAGEQTTVEKTIVTNAPTETATTAPTPTVSPTPTQEPTPTYIYVPPTSTPMPIIPATTIINSVNTQQQPCSEATALCSDGTCSYAAHHQGACSHHGGVAQFYQ